MDNQDLQQEEEEEENAYDREPPLDRETVRANRQRSKYVFMTLCFILSLALFYTYFTKSFISDSSSWFPLFGGVILAIMGVVFLRSSDSPPASQQAVAPTPSSPSSQGILSPFETLVQEALATIPAAFQEKMENVMVHVVYEPDHETLTHAGVEPEQGSLLLGLYEGVPLTVYGRDNVPYPEQITIFQRTIEEYCRHDPERIREQVRATVLHEVAHHFGMGHEQMPIWIKE
jgi:predicted Zn-dependent protease with MMP-like domain